jgi:hypothetical protein
MVRRAALHQELVVGACRKFPMTLATPAPYRSEIERMSVPGLRARA